MKRGNSYRPKLKFFFVNPVSCSREEYLRILATTEDTETKENVEYFVDKDKNWIRESARFHDLDNFFANR